MHGHHRRDRDHPQGRAGAPRRPEPPRTAGGRTENYARQRDEEQMRAGYERDAWERDPESYRTVRSEPDWDPTRYAREREPRDLWGTEPHTREMQHKGSWHEEDRSHERARYEPGEPGGFPRGLGPEHREWGVPEEHHLGRKLEDAGRRFAGRVRRLVRNPKNYTRSDERIREDICDRLSVSSEVDPTEIEVTVNAGEVTLSGFVADRQMKFVAEEIADEVPGVHDVHNQLRIPRAMPSASNISINAQQPADPSKRFDRS